MSEITPFQLATLAALIRTNAQHFMTTARAIDDALTLYLSCEERLAGNKTAAQALTVPETDQTEYQAPIGPLSDHALPRSD